MKVARILPLIFATISALEIFFADGEKRFRKILHFNELTRVGKQKSFFLPALISPLRAQLHVFPTTFRSKVQEMKTEMHFLPLRYEQFCQKAIFLVYQKLSAGGGGKLKGESTGECKLQETVNCII